MKCALLYFLNKLCTGNKLFKFKNIGTENCKKKNIKYLNVLTNNKNNYKHN